MFACYSSAPEPAPADYEDEDENDDEDDDDDSDNDEPLPDYMLKVLKEAEPLSKKGKKKKKKKMAMAAETGACVVCYEHRASICLIPCGHKQMCDDCVRAMWRALSWEAPFICPTCRADIVDLVRPIE
jgi:hypothetical protein